MTKETISKFAYMDQMPETEMTCPERCLWYALRDVYRRYHAGEITKGRAAMDKLAALRQYDLDAGKLLEADRVLTRNATMWMEIELAANMYRMDRTLENADTFVGAVYGVKLKSPAQAEHEAGEAV